MAEASFFEQNFMALIASIGALALLLLLLLICCIMRRRKKKAQVKPQTDAEQPGACDGKKLEDGSDDGLKVVASNSSKTVGEAPDLWSMLPGSNSSPASGALAPLGGDVEAPQEEVAGFVQISRRPPAVIRPPVEP